MPNEFHGPGFVGPEPIWATFVSTGMAFIFWIAIVSLAIWVVYQLRRAQLGGGRVQPAFAPKEPSAVELLRRRYVLGEIDALAFESMLESVLASEVSYEAAQQLLAQGTADAGVPDEYGAYASEAE